jgi:site-specific DNA-cytosine methylase
MINASLVSAQNRRRYFWCGQIRERLYYNDVLCYTCLYNENRGIQTKTQRKRDAEVLDETQERHSDVQGMSERISQNKSQGNNQDLLFKMSGNQQKEQRQKQGQTKESGLSENVSTEEQKETDRVSEEISSISNRKAENGGSRQTTAQVNYKEDTGILSSSAYRDKEKINEGGSDVNFRNGTKMCCVRCNQKLNNRPFNTFIQRGNERFEQFTSDVSKLQFKETQQNNGRIYDIYQVEIPQPEDKGILLKDILEENVDEKYYVKGVDVSKQGKIIGRELEKSHSLMARDYKGFGNQSMTGVQRIGSLNSGGQGLEFLGGIGNKDWAGDGKKYSRNFPQGNRVYGSNGKSTTLSANGGGRGAKTGLYAVEDKSYCVPSTYYKENVKSLIQRKKKGLMVNENTTIRKLTPIECERLQGLPDNYTEGVSNTQRYKALGNAFNVDVVAHILSFIPKC